MATAQREDQELVRSIAERVVEDLAMITDREFVIQAVDVRRAGQKAVGEGQIHISFKLGFHLDGQVRHGCILVPLPDAISLASYLMMVPDESVSEHRGDQDLDRATKEAMLETGNFIGGAVDAALRKHWNGQVSVRTEGCQGVAPDLPPAFPYRKGSELLIGRVTAKLHEYPSFPMVMLLPVLEG